MRILFTLLLLFPLYAHALVEGNLLAPKQAFELSTHLVDAKRIEVRYHIADGYYLYRGKFRFSVQPSGATLGTPRFPAGKTIHDPFFGREEVYRHEIKIVLPLHIGNNSVRNITLKATAQGCADAGVCYPPLTQTVQLTLPTPSSPATGLAALARLGNNLGGSSQDEFLPPDLAFGLKVAVTGPDTVVANFKPAASYYLYRDKIHFSLRNSSGVKIAKVVLPAGETEAIPTLGTAVVYHHPFRATIHLSRSDTARAALTLVAGYQGCSEKGVCYPPINKTFKLTLPAAAGGTAAPARQAAQPAPEAIAQGAAPRQSAIGGSSESQQIARLFVGGHFWLIVAFFFGAGLLLAFTPCVFPMIPILSGIIAGQGHRITKGRSLLLSLSYVLGMAITYAAAGIIAGLSGTMLTAAMQNPWVLGAFALVFVALSLSMFGFYELQLPAFLQSKFSGASNRMKGGSTAGVFVMGALSALIVGPCVAAPLAGALLYIGQTHNVWLGGTALFAMALGMGVPLILVGISAGALLPKAGSWMDAVKAFFGALLLGVAIWIISPVIPPLAAMLLWSALLIISAMYLRAMDPLPHTARGFARLWKGLGIIILVTGVAILVGALSGGRNVLQPLSSLDGASSIQGKASKTLSFERVRTVAELKQRLVAARGHYVMLDFYADWCVDCKEFEHFTFTDPRVQKKLKGVVLLQVDVTANNAGDRALLRKFGLYGPPGIIFFDQDGREIKAARTVGYKPPDRFLAILDKALR